MIKKLLVSTILALLSFTALAGSKADYISSIQYGNYYNDPQTGLQFPQDSATDTSGNSLYVGAVFVRAPDVAIVTQIGNSIKIDMIDGTTATWNAAGPSEASYLWRKFIVSTYPSPVSSHFMNIDASGANPRKVSFNAIKSATCAPSVNSGYYVLTLNLKTGATVTAQGWSNAFCSNLTN